MTSSWSTAGTRLRPAFFVSRQCACARAVVCGNVICGPGSVMRRPRGPWPIPELFVGGRDLRNALTRTMQPVRPAADQYCIVRPAPADGPGTCQHWLCGHPSPCGRPVPAAYYGHQQAACLHCLATAVHSFSPSIVP